MTTRAHLRHHGLRLATVILLALLAQVLLSPIAAPAMAQDLQAVGHRGDRQNHPDNSWAGISSAFRLGADYVEIDVIYNTDANDLFLTHDRQCANGVYADTSPAATVVASCGLQTLSATLDNYAAAGLRYFAIEIKETSASRQYAANRVQSLVEARGLQNTVWVTAFSEYQLDALLDSSIKLMRNKAPNLAGPVSSTYLKDTADRGYDGVNIALGDWNASQVDYAQSLGLTASTWKLDLTGGFKETQNQQAIDLGVDWAMTDRVADLVSRLG